MNKYKILSWIFLVLAVIGLGLTIWIALYTAGPVVCPLDTPLDTASLCEIDYGPLIAFVVADIIFWLGFIYFLRKSRKS